MATTTEMTPTGQKWSGRWQQFTGRVKSLWGGMVSDEELQADGEYERVMGKLQEKTGQTREQLEKLLGD